MDKEDFYSMIDHLPDILLDCFKRYLEIESDDQLSLDYDIFALAGDELDCTVDVWELPSPERFTSVMTLDYVHTPTFSIGYVEFGVYGGRKVILEQNASPLLVYWKNVRVTGK